MVNFATAKQKVYNMTDEVKKKKNKTVELTKTLTEALVKEGVVKADDTFQMALAKILQLKKGTVEKYETINEVAEILSNKAKDIGKKIAQEQLSKLDKEKEKWQELAK